MITQFQLKLMPDRNCRPRAEWAYCLYAALLKQTAGNFGDTVHQDTVTPVSQYLTFHGKEILWRVTLLGEISEQNLTPVLEQTPGITLDNEQVYLRVAERSARRIESVEQLFHQVVAGGSTHRLQILTPTAFKSQGYYLNLPTTRLIIQNLVRKWNGCIAGCPIDDEDSKCIETLAAGLCCREFQLSSQDYYLKGHPIPGFVGTITLENHLSGVQRQLANALLIFSEYAGVGIKTTLGMGGIERR